MLQWSHGILAMDSTAALDRFVPSGRLQWSHGILAMDRSISRLDLIREKDGFNGAMAF